MSDSSWNRTNFTYHYVCSDNILPLCASIQTLPTFALTKPLRRQFSILSPGSTFSLSLSLLSPSRASLTLSLSFLIVAQDYLSCIQPYAPLPTIHLPADIITPYVLEPAFYIRCEDALLTSGEWGSSYGQIWQEIGKGYSVRVNTDGLVSGTDIDLSVAVRYVISDEEE